MNESARENIKYKTAVMFKVNLRAAVETKSDVKCQKYKLKYIPRHDWEDTLSRSLRIYRLWPLQTLWRIRWSSLHLKTWGRMCLQQFTFLWHQCLLDTFEGYPLLQQEEICPARWHDSTSSFSSDLHPGDGGRSSQRHTAGQPTSRWTLYPTR